MIGIDLGERAKITVDGIGLTVGLIPFGKLRELEIRIAPLMRDYYSTRPPKEGATPEQVETHAAVVDRVTAPLVEIHTDVIRWGLRAWSLDRPLTTASAIFGGRTFDVVRPECLDGLAHANSGWTLIGIGIRIIAANTLTLDDVLGFK